ncbi:hypothetical protein P4Y30_004439 [Salmonella enterica]|nr:hypothetical protein [Salmonella enterica]EKQ3116041.1 hypothetical protein [Salmonella enterica]
MKKPKIEITFIKIRDCSFNSVPANGRFYWHCPETEYHSGGLYEVVDGDWVSCADGGSVHKSHLQGVIGTMLEPKYKVTCPKSLY